MTQKILTCLLGLTLVFASLPHALAQDKANGSTPPLPDWQGLADLTPGKKIVVYTRQGKIFEDHKDLGPTAGAFSLADKRNLDLFGRAATTHYNVCLV